MARTTQANSNYNSNKMAIGGGMLNYESMIEATDQQDQFIDVIPSTISRTKTLTKSKNGSNMGMQSSMPNNLKVLNSKHSVNSKDAAINSNDNKTVNGASKSFKIEKKAKS